MSQVGCGSQFIVLYSLFTKVYQKRVIQMGLPSWKFHLVQIEHMKSIIPSVSYTGCMYNEYCVMDMEYMDIIDKYINGFADT